MKYLKITVIASLSLLIGFIISCESDDICPDSESTTPRLIIEAYDVSNQENLKSIPSLLIVGVDNENILDGYAFVAKNKLLLPLKTDVNTTQYRLIKDAEINDNGTPDNPDDDFLEGNQDIISISYSRREIYVSRACGYKTIFENVTLNIEPDNDNWIKARQPLNDNQSVENETETHFNIYH
ncbi:DUF6452 family protein [Gaetbulibacter saemankumensis]|uniref:DUF6452 family protein n=1 Tax=Gaetbulibacter saemankumensis TaxID=311208 RepID=UPI000413D3FC|nr:DUF6452 family protein [Gaetbulibacter saemankumensis]